MGKKSYGDFACGMQYSIQMYDYASQIGQFDTPVSQIIRKQEISMLQQKGVKFNENDLVFATMDNNGNVFWLENGSEKSGLIHIKNRHMSDFNNIYGIKEIDIPGFIKNLIVCGKMLGEREVVRNGKNGFERIYEYDDKHFTLAGIGKNGYIVSVYPIRKDKK